MGLNIMCGGGQKVLVNDELGEAQEYDIITGVARGINAISWNNNDFCQAVSKGNKVYYFDNYRTGYYIFDGARIGLDIFKWDEFMYKNKLGTA